MLAAALMPTLVATAVVLRLSAACELLFALRAASATPPAMAGVLWLVRSFFHLFLFCYWSAAFPRIPSPVFRACCWNGESLLGLGLA